MSDTFSAFVIGPMGADKNLPSEQGTPISEHMVNIEAALRAVLPRFVRPPIRYEVYTPEGGGADIVDYVFGHIDDADVAVADISRRSPSVMYEMAYFHALGTPVIVIDDSSLALESPFYLRGTNVIRTSDFSVGNLISIFNDRFQKFFAEYDAQDFSINPITKFYSAPLVEISGAATIARGYFRNFIEPILHRNYGVISNYKDKKINKLYIVKPTNILSVSEDMREFRSLMGGRSEITFTVQDAGEERHISAYLVEDAIVDYPRTAGMLSTSPRLGRIKVRPGLSKTRIDDIRSKTIERLLSVFFESIDNHIENRDDLYRTYFDYIDFKELRALVNSAPQP